MIHATEILSGMAARLTYDDLPPEAIEATRLFIADYYAACFAGYKVNAVFNEAVAAEFADMGGKAEASALFSGKKLPAVNAAFMNAAYAHGADMDDGNRKAMGHIGAHVLSAVFALAETLSVSGRQVFATINVGYEVYNRVAAAAQPGLVRRGFHSTGTAGAIACGAACAKLLGMDERGIYNTMALSAIQASGLLIIAQSGQSCKPINPANAARTGILSAKLVSRGVQSALYPLESAKGWFHAMTDAVDEDMITDRLGERFTICESYIKPYPACRHTHCCIDAAFDIRAQAQNCGRSFKSCDIRAVTVRIYHNAIQIAGQILVPQTPDDSKFSIHYALATALVLGRFGLDDLDISAAPPEVWRVAGCIQLVPDASMENRDTGVRGAHVAVEMADGSVWQKLVTIPKGEAANPFTWDDMERKMSACAAGYYDASQVAEMIRRIRRIDAQERFVSVADVL